MAGTKRTIEDLHDKEVGHRKFAKICDLLVEKGHKVENIVEYYEKFKFDVDGFWFTYQKAWKSSAKDFVEYLLNMLEMKKLLSQEPKKVWRF